MTITLFVPRSWRALEIEGFLFGRHLLSCGLVFVGIVLKPGVLTCRFAFSPTRCQGEMPLQGELPLVPPGKEKERFLILCLRTIRVNTFWAVFLATRRFDPPAFWPKLKKRSIPFIHPPFDPGGKAPDDRQATGFPPAPGVEKGLAAWIPTGTLSRPVSKG